MNKIIDFIRDKCELGAHINNASVESQISISEIGVHVVYLVDDSGVPFQTQQSVAKSNYLYVCTTIRRSNSNVEKEKQIALVEEGDDYVVATEQ